MKHGFLKIATAHPSVRIADTVHNAREMTRLAHDADALGVRVLVFPELSLTGYTCGDLFFSDTLIDAARYALADYLNATAQTEVLSLAGLPLPVGNRLYSCTAVCYRGKLLGIVPKLLADAYGVANDARHFATFVAQNRTSISLFGEEVPFGADLLFSPDNLPALCLAVAAGKEWSVLLSPADRLAAAGATLICCPDASYESVVSADARRTALQARSTQLTAALAYASAGEGESTTDAVFGGHGLIVENGKPLAERSPFDTAKELAVSEIDLELLVSERRRNGFPIADTCPTIGFSISLTETTLTRTVDPHPFIPADKATCDSRCETILRIQSEGLRRRTERAFAKKLVLGISGGLDSTLALLVAVRAIDALKRPRTDILAVTMPCFGTTKRTKTNATVLCEELGVDFRCVDIFDAVNQHFSDIGHDPECRDVTYENCQARERTQVLMDIANDCGGMVVGTGDLSELALGWATYNGDHMSMYGVNAGVPKTLIRHVVAYAAGQFRQNGDCRIADALCDVLDTPVSPELLPASESGEIAQKTEDLVGPYELHDFYLYYLIRFGFSPTKLYRLAKHALGSVYDDETLKKWLKVLLRRFFSQQFKRSCLPDGPAVGSVSLSPRGAWQMPSDATSALWLVEAETL